MQVFGSYTRECDRENFFRRNPGFEQLRDASLHGKGFAGARTGYDAHTRFGRCRDPIGYAAFIQTRVPSHRTALQ